MRTTLLAPLLTLLLLLPALAVANAEVHVIGVYGHVGPNARLVASYTIRPAALLSKGVVVWSHSVVLPPGYKAAVVLEAIGSPKPAPRSVESAKLVAGIPMPGARVPSILAEAVARVNAGGAYRLLLHPTVTILERPTGTIIVASIPLVFARSGELLYYPEVRVLVYAEPAPTQPQQVKMLILTTPSLKKIAEDIASIEESRGAQVKVVTTADASSYEPASIPHQLGTGALALRVVGVNETALRIISMLREYAKEGYRYLLIVGSAASVPPSAYVYAPLLSDLGTNFSLVPTDYFYAAPWGGTKLVYAVARIPLDEPTQLQAYIRMMRASLSGVPGNLWAYGGPTFNTPLWYGEALVSLISTSAQGLSFHAATYTLGNETMEAFARGLSSGGVLVVMAHGDGMGFYDYDPNGGWLSGPSTILTWPSLVQYAATTNLEVKPNVVLSVACLNAAWDTKLVNITLAPLSLGEALLAYGLSSAYVGFSRPSFALAIAEAPMGIIRVIPLAAGYLVGSTASLLARGVPLGDAYLAAVEAYLQQVRPLLNAYLGDVGNSIVWTVVAEYSLLGDPLLRASVAPQTMPTLSIPAVKPIDAYVVLPLGYIQVNMTFTYAGHRLVLEGDGELVLGKVKLLPQSPSLLDSMQYLAAYTRVANATGTLVDEPLGPAEGVLLATMYRSGVGGEYLLQYLARGGVVVRNSVVYAMGLDVLTMWSTPVAVNIDGELHLVPQDVSDWMIVKPATTVVVEPLNLAPPLATGYTTGAAPSILMLLHYYEWNAVTLNDWALLPAILVKNTLLLR